MRLRIAQLARMIVLAPPAALFVVSLLDLPLSYLSPHGYRRSTPRVVPEDPLTVVRGRTFFAMSDHGLVCLNFDASTVPVARLTRSSLPEGRLLPADIPPYRFRRTFGFCLAWRTASLPFDAVSIAVAFPHWFAVLVTAVPLLPGILRYRRSRAILPGGFPIQTAAGLRQPPPPDAASASPLG